MPNCGSQIILCDIPIRFDTYNGCGHGCSYCFVSRKADISKIKTGESAASLLSFIKGKRGGETEWCDWDIPLHWGGVSDPFQPIERKEKRSLAALEVFAETGYPFVVSTKSTLIAEKPYLDLIKRCNCVVQFSAASPQYDKIERGAATFAQRIEAAAKITPYKRVNIRIQPFIPAIFGDVLREMKDFAAAGIYGIVVEGMKFTKPRRGLVSVGNDFVFPTETLIPQFEAIRNSCHKNGIRFYCGENRLRSMSDDLCCCGIDGLGWRVNTMNLNHLLFDPDTVVVSEKMREKGNTRVFDAINQSLLAQKENRERTFEEIMRTKALKPIQFISGGGCTFTKEQEAAIRQYLRDALKKSGRKAKDVDRLLGTNGMAGHYFGASQWAFPTREAYAKMRTILPLDDVDELLRKYGVRNTPGYIYRTKTN